MPRKSNRVLQVLTVLPVARMQRRVLGVQPAVDPVSDEECPAAGAVVGAGAVVLHPAAKLGEHQHRHVVGRVVRP